MADLLGILERHEARAAQEARKQWRMPSPPHGLSGVFGIEQGKQQTPEPGKPVVVARIWPTDRLPDRDVYLNVQWVCERLAQGAPVHSVFVHLHSNAGRDGKVNLSQEALESWLAMLGYAHDVANSLVDCLRDHGIIVAPWVPSWA